MPSSEGCAANLQQTICIVEPTISTSLDRMGGHRVQRRTVRCCRFSDVTLLKSDIVLVLLLCPDWSSDATPHSPQRASQLPCISPESTDGRPARVGVGEPPREITWRGDDTSCFGVSTPPENTCTYLPTGSAFFHLLSGSRYEVGASARAGEEGDPWADPETGKEGARQPASVIPPSLPAGIIRSGRGQPFSRAHRAATGK